MSKRKPLNDTDGYVASLKTPFGYVMIVDRKNGGDWICSAERWIVSAHDHDLSNIAMISVTSLRRAREVMKDARDTGFLTDWIFGEAA